MTPAVKPSVAWFLEIIFVLEDMCLPPGYKNCSSCEIKAQVTNSYIAFAIDGY